MIYAICFESARGTMYLNCVETCLYGDRVIGYFDLRRSCAMPLERYHADKLLVKLQETSLSKSLQVIPYPAPSEEVQHEG